MPILELNEKKITSAFRKPRFMCNMLIFATRLVCTSMVLATVIAAVPGLNKTSTGEKLVIATESPFNENSDIPSIDEIADVNTAKTEAMETEQVSNYIRQKLSRVIGERYASCEKRYECRGMCVSKLPCLCDASKCRLLQNCCPDVKAIPVLQSVPVTPKCIQLHYLLYTFRRGDSIILKDKNHTQSLNSASAFGNESGSAKQNGKDRTDANVNTYFSPPNSINNDQESIQPSELRRIQSTSFPFYWVFDSCPSGFTDSFTINMCEKEFSDEIKDIVPVVSWTGSIYKNRYCAICHNETYTKSWQVITNCMYMYTWPSLPRTLTELLYRTKECLVLLEPYWITQTLSDASICEKSMPEKNVISSTEIFDDNSGSNKQSIGHCNATGLWPRWNNHISQRCEARADMRAMPDKSDSTVVYKNIFCYICNTDGTTLDIAPSGINYDTVFSDGYVRMDVEVDKDISPQLVMLDSNVEEPYPCARDMVFGVYKEGCLKLRCPLDTLATSGLCLVNNRDVKGLVASAAIHVKPVFKSGTSEHSLENTTFHKTAKQLMTKLTDFLRFKTNKCDLMYAEVLGDSKTGDYVTIVKIANTITCSTSFMVSMFKTVVVEAASVTVRNSFGLAQTYALSMHYAYIDRTQYDVNVKLVDKNLTYEFPLDRGFYCPSVGLNASSLSFLSKSSNIRKIIKNRQQHDLTADGDLVYICFTVYLEQWVIDKYNLRPQHVEITANVDLPSILTLLTSVVSIMSTVIVIVTYSLFSELRCIPGKLFMVLCFNILASQCVFVFGISSENSLSVWCKVAGVFIHVFWLSTIFAMHSCLWLMYRTISHPLENDYLAMINSNSNLFALCYVLPNYVLPALLSTGNILGSTFLYNDRYHGYGGGYCFISIPRMKLFTFIVPICLVLTVNCVLFGMIMFYIRNAVIRSTNITKRHEHITAFFKLSTMTGIFWLFGVLYETSGFHVFKYLFIILNGGQGFLLMWSFLLNRRVCSMFQTLYIRYVHRPQDSFSLSTSSSSFKHDGTCASSNRQETSDV